MKPDKQPARAAPTPAQTSPNASSGIGASSSNNDAAGTKPAAAAAAPSPTAGRTASSTRGTVDDDDLAKLMDMWWDGILAFFNRHRALAAMAVWLGVFLFDVMDLHMPAEWLVFTFFSFSVFVQAFGMSVVFFTALTVAMTVVNVAIFYLVPFTTTSLFSTIVVCMLLVRGVHGLDTKGWAITALMSLSRLYTPWCEILPEYLQAPIAAYCTSFGILWLAYHNSRRLERLLDPICLLLGVIPPPAPRLSIVEISDTNVIVSWAQDPQNIGLPDTACANTSNNSAHLGGLAADARPGLQVPSTAGGHGVPGLGRSNSSSSGSGHPEPGVPVPATLTSTMPASAVSSSALLQQQHQPFVHPSSMLNVTGASPPSSSSSSAAAATATNPIIGLSSVSVAGTFTSGAAAGTHSTTSSGSGDLANATSLSIGGIVTIERKGLAEARVSKYEIEVNGRIVGECKNTEDYTNIQRLKPSCIYQLRVWAISESRGRAPSQPIFVHTLSTREAQMRASTSQKDASPSNSASNDNSSAVDVNSIRLDIDISQRKIKALEENIAQLKAHSEDEKGRLQKEIAELKTKRKEEESAKTVQREKIRELEAEKRRLDREKDRLDKEIADARNRKQRALEWMQEQEKQAETCLRNAKALEDAMERESRDHQQQQAELKNTIHVIKMEVGKVKQRLDGLTSQQIDISEQLKDKRATLAVQEKKNAELERKLKEALQRRQPTKEDRAKVAQYNERIQAEIDLLVPQLNETTCERQRLEMAVGSIKHTADATSPIPIAARHSPVYGIGGVSTANLPGGGVAKSQTFSYPMKSLPARRSQNMRGNSGSASNDGTASHHARSSSFTADAQPGQRAQDSLASIQTSALAPLGYSSQLTGSMDSSPVATRIGFNSAAARRSTDLSDLLSFWDRYNALSVAAPTSPTSASIAQPANAFMRHRGIVPSTAAIDSLSLINASGSSVATIHAFDSDSGVGGIGSVDFEYGRHLSPVGGSRPQFWGSPSSASSLSTTTAEASALSILKDTDLAYPTPERPSQREARKYAELMARRDYSQAQPPPQPLFGNTSSGFKNHHQRALGRMLAGSFESLDQQRGMSAQTSPHFRFNSLDMRAAGAWPDFDYPGQPGALGSVGAGASAGVGAGGAASSDNGGGDGRESGRSSTVNDRLSSPCADGAGDTDPFSLRSITPADQPSMLLSNGDLLGIHRPLASSAALHERPHVEPIGAPVRRRPGPSSPPPGSAAQGKQMAPAPAQRNELCPANGPFKIPIQREISHPSSFGNSLYQKRSLWDIDIPSSEQQHRSAAKK